jgi:hypothetical protein
MARTRPTPDSAAEASDSAMPGLRPAKLVMSPARAAAAVPNAMSFSRAAMRQLVRGRWSVEKLRFDLDNEGRGEVLYRLVGDGWVFHFFLISTKLPEELKTDRNFAQSWDAMGVLCQGEWTLEREAHLRSEVPKQRAGYADYDTLIYARGNRSGRLFEHVVESLAAGRQPDAHLLAPVGYILRTTAFIGNGQLGTRPLAGYEPDHPFRRPYHAQFCSAFMLREYVFDLVDHLAKARNPDAARLAPEYRRYLGLGNAAATGLVPFVVNHPHLMHQWCMTHEVALANAKRHPVAPGDDVSNRFASLLEKAIRHFTQSARPNDGVFATTDTLVADLQAAQTLFDPFQHLGTIDHRRATLPWVALAEWAQRNLHLEAIEILNSIIIELYPDIVEAAADSFRVDERFELQAEMPVATLRELVEKQYGWALDREYRDDPAAYFWYRTTKAPRDVRRGVRGLAAALESETTMDTIHQTQRLWACIEAADDSTSVADIVRARPDLRHIVTRVQSLAGLDYAELRANWLSDTFSPFGAIRLVLSFYGLEKFEAVLPKSVRGTFMQGAPIAEDVEKGIDGDWPFPLMPTPASHSQHEARAVQPFSTPYATASAAAGCAVESDAPSNLVIAPNELARMAQSALQGHGAPLGVAEAGASLVAFAHSCGRRACEVLLRHCADGLVSLGAEVGLTERGERHAEIDAHGASALVAAPAALDLALVRASASPDGVGSTLVRNAKDPSLVAELALRCAERGFVGVLMWHADLPAEDGGAGFAVAGPSHSGPWYVDASLPAPASLHVAVGTGADLVAIRAASPAEQLAKRIGEALSPADGATDVGSGFLIVCITPPSASEAAKLFDVLTASLLAGLPSSRRVWSGTELASRRTAWLQRGVVLSRRQFDALSKAGEALLVPVEEEHRVLKDGADPLKVF